MPKGCNPYITRGWSLEAKVAYYTDIRADHECWPWMSSRNPKGYPELKWMGRKRQVHRLMSGVPAHLQVRHTCDHPWCVNPTHWLFGTNDDNQRDRRERGRLGLGVLRGHDNGSSVLTPEQVVGLRTDHMVLTYSELAIKYAISKKTVWRVVKHRSYK